MASLRPTGDQAEQLAVRTDGNPFFLVEYARLARERGDLDALMGETTAPTAVHDVVTRRVDRLPESAARSCAGPLWSAASSSSPSSR